MTLETPSFGKPLIISLGITLLLNIAKALPYVGPFFTEITPVFMAFIFTFLAYHFIFSEDSERRILRYLASHLIIVFVSLFVFGYLYSLIATKYHYAQTKITYSQAKKQIDQELDQEVGKKGIIGFTLWQLKKTIDLEAVKRDFVYGNEGFLDTIINIVPYLIISYFSITKWAGAFVIIWYYLATLIIGIIGGYFAENGV